MAGAGLASTVAIAAGVVMLGFYFIRLEKYVALHPAQWAPRFAVWGRLLKIGLPAGGEFALMFIYFALIFWVIRRFGAEAQAGFGVGSRVMQSIMLPAMAIATLASRHISAHLGGARRFLSSFHRKNAGRRRRAFFSSCFVDFFGRDRQATASQWPELHAQWRGVDRRSGGCGRG